MTSPLLRITPSGIAILCKALQPKKTVVLDAGKPLRNHDARQTSHVLQRQGLRCW